MSLDHKKHVEACALLNRLLQDFAPVIPYRAVIESWLDENRPEPEAYKAALSSLAAEREQDSRDYHRKVTAINAAHDTLLAHRIDNFDLAQEVTEAVLTACFARPAEAEHAA